MPTPDKPVAEAARSAVAEAAAVSDWLVIAMLAVIISGFSFLTYLSFQASNEAQRQRDRIEQLQRQLLAQQSQQAQAQAAADERATRAVNAVQSLLEAERPITREIVHEEVQAGPTTTTTATVTKTATATMTVSCAPAAGACVPPKPPKSGALARIVGLICGLTGCAYVAVRRTL